MDDVNFHTNNDHFMSEVTSSFVPRRIAVVCSLIALCVTLSLSSITNAMEMTLPDDPTQTVQGQVIGGTPALSKDWPATLVFINPGVGRCTATAIGERIILVAAHCIENNAVGKIRLPAADVNVTCKHHPSYPGDISADFAVCLTGSALPALPFESINVSNSLPSLNQQITLLGYGCRQKDGVDNSFGTLFIGTATVSALPSGNSYYTRTNGGAAVCFGDSGGGAYMSTDAAGRKRALFAVNSRGNISTDSWLSTTSRSGFLDWIKGIAVANNTMICGVHPSATGCRGN